MAFAVAIIAIVLMLVIIAVGGLFAMQQIIERIGVLVCYRYRSNIGIWYRSNIGIYRVDWRNIGIGSMLRIDRTLLSNIICIMLTNR